MRYAYLTLCGLTIAGYSSLALMGWELTSPPRQVMGQTVRSSPGGYRSFHFWHSGYHGGK